MPARVRQILLSMLLLTSVSVAAAAPMPWAHLKVGMAVEEIISLLGEPLMRCAARGFETWTYDDGAEVLICGMVVGWTMPASISTAPRSQDVWRSHPKGDYLGTLRTAMRQNGAKAPVTPGPKRSAREARPAIPGMGYEEYSTRG